MYKTRTLSRKVFYIDVGDTPTQSLMKYIDEVIDEVQTKILK